MKKKIFVLISFETDGWNFASSIHNTLEEAREAQMNWLKKEWGFYRKDTPPTKDEIYEGKDESVYYSEDGEYMSINFGDFCDSYSKIETHEIEIAHDNGQDELQRYADSIVIEGEDGELKHYHGTFNDGYAILTDDETGETATLFYPLLGDLTQEQVRAIEEYSRRPLSEYYQIAVKYGKIEKQERT